MAPCVLLSTLRAARLGYHIPQPPIFVHKHLLGYFQSWRKHLKFQQVMMARQMALIWQRIQRPRNCLNEHSNSLPKYRTCKLTINPDSTSTNEKSTPGKELEKRLNRDYGPGNEYYEDFCKLIKQGWEEGWVATGDLDRGIYRRGRVIIQFYSLQVYTTNLRADPNARRRQPLYVSDLCLL